MNAPIMPAKLSHSGRVQRVVSPGGIEAWLVEEHAVPLFALEFSFAAGSSHDPAGKSGTAAMLAALLDEGAGDLNAEAFQEALAEKAIELRFNIGRDWFHGSMKTLSDNGDEAIRLLRLAVTQARIDSDAVERIRAQFLADLKFEANEADAIASRNFFIRAFGSHPYAANSTGSMETIPAITREDLLAYRAAALARNNLTITCVGDMDAGRLAAAIDDIFGDLPAAHSLADTPTATILGLGDVQVHDLDVPQTTFVFGAPGLVTRDPDYISAAVVNHILGEGTFTSRLWQEVREKRGLAYSVRTSLHAIKHGPIYYGSTSTKNERAKEALEIIQAEIARMAHDGPTEAELEQAKRFMIGSYALRFDTSTKIASELTSIAFQGLGIDYIDRRNALVAAVTLDDAKRVAKRLYGEGRMVVSAAGRPVGL